MKVVSWFVCLSVFGCAQAKPASDDCTAAATAIKAKWMLKATSELTGADLAQAAKSLELGLARRCTDDRWSAEATACFQALESRGEGCGDMLTSEQKQQLASDPRTATIANREKKAGAATP